jgi:hypothetical protein
LCRLDRFHETQKPLALMRRLIRKHSRRGDLVVDPFAGSGTTGVAALMESRRFAGCEPNERYFPKALQRMRRRAGSTIGTGSIRRQERFARSYADRKVALQQECAAIVPCAKPQPRVVTDNRREFDRVPRLAVEDWLAPG